MVITLPATDLYLMGRQDVRNVRRGLTPIKRLRAAGVTVAAATNNVQNAFTPAGNADPLLLTYLLVVGAHMGGEGDMAAALDMVTAAPARISQITAARTIAPPATWFGSIGSPRKTAARTNVTTGSSVDSVAASAAPSFWIPAKKPIIATTVDTTAIPGRLAEEQALRGGQP